jgi:hypothetical protein
MRVSQKRRDYCRNYSRTNEVAQWLLDALWAKLGDPICIEVMIGCERLGSIATDTYDIDLQQ